MTIPLKLHVGGMDCAACATKIENAIKENVLLGVQRLKGLEPILAGMVKKGEVKVVGAVYELRTGTVRFLD